MKCNILSVFRVQPDFLIIGVMKGGTTALYNYMAAVFPEFIPTQKKEVHYFDNNFDSSIARRLWYKSHFPWTWQKWQADIKKQRLVTGEASPFYVAHPLVPHRVYKYNSDMKLILILRDPVKRAYSQYQHQIRKKAIGVSFAEALAIEEKTVEQEYYKLEHNQPSKYQFYSYVDRGKYIDQILRWTKYFDRKQLKIIISERLNQNPQQILLDLKDYLNLTKFDATKIAKQNVSDYSPMQNDIKQKLSKIFRPYNQRLEEYLGYEIKEWSN